MTLPATTIRFSIGARSADGSYPLVAFSPGGQTRGTLTLPTHAPDYQEILERLASFEADAETSARLGKLLFDALFSPEIRDSYRATRTLLAHGQRLRIVLDIPADAAELAATPWEFLWDPEADAPLALRGTSVVRYLPQTIRVPAIEVAPPLRVLITAAQTDPPVDVQRELAVIQAALEELGNRVQVTVEPNLTVERLQAHLRADYHVWHFVGHGGMAEDGTSLLMLEDGHGGVAPLDSGQLAALLASSGVRLAVLDACGSGQVRTSPMQSTAIALVAAGIPAVIAMQLPVPEETTRTFATALYQALADGEPIDACVTEGRKAILTTVGHRPDWGIPVVLTRTLDGRLFAPAPLEAATSPSPATHSERNLRVLRGKVRSFWVDGVLHNSLAQAVMIDLGLETRPGTTIEQWDAVVQRPGDPSQHLPPGTNLIDVFDEHEQALLILGAPGSGKTTMLLELARVLLDRAERDPSFPAPVVFNLSSWAQRRATLEVWLVEELFARYDVPRRLGGEWVAAGQILPLLDGLDEVAAAQREACVAAINTFRENHGLLPLAVCCRTGDYDALATKLQLAGTVVVQLLAPEQVDNALALGGEPLVRLRTAVRDDEGLRELAQTPLMLSVMMLAFRGVAAPIALGAGRAEQRAGIFDAYIEAMFARRGVPPYGRDATLAWLAWLAHTMRRQAQSVFLIEGLQAAWLASGQTPSRYLLLDRLGWGAAIALVVGVVLALAALLSGMWDGGGLIALAFGLLLGCGSALFGGRPRAAGAANARVVATDTLLGGLLGGLLGAAVFGPLIGATTPLVSYLEGAAMSGVIGGIVFALFGALVGRPGLRPREVRTSERLRWSWRRARGVAVGSGCIVGLLGGVGAALFIVTAADRLGMGLGGALVAIPLGMLVGSFLGLPATLIGGLIGGLEGGDVGTTTRPNQGLRRSAWIAALTGGGFALVFGLIGAAGGPLLALLLAFAAGLPIALAYGGYAVLSHFALRLLLWRQRVMPWNYAAFLDAAAARVFLRKVGGGYIFIHRLLLEHLAMHNEATTATTPEEIEGRPAGTLEKTRRV